MGIERAIVAAVESAGVPWAHRNRVAGAAALADSLAAIVGPLDVGHKKDFLASLIGECAQESDWYCASREYGGANASYAPYYGRGFIQLTHRVNYIGFTTYARGKYSDCPDFVANPDAIVFDLKWCWLTGIYYYIANIREDYWARHDWDSISGIINAGNPGYRGPSWGLRSAACNAAYDALGDDWGDDMPSADEVAKAVWQYGVKIYGRSNQEGKEVPAGVVLGWLDDQFNWTGARVLEAETGPAAARVSVADLLMRIDERLSGLSGRLDELEAQSSVPQRAAEEVFDSQSETTGPIPSEAGATGDGADFYGIRPERAVIAEVEGMPGWYKVQRGDTARWIAKMAGLRYSELVAMNPELASSFGHVTAGQLLRVRQV